MVGSGDDANRQSKLTLALICIMRRLSCRNLQCNISSPKFRGKLEVQVVGRRMVLVIMFQCNGIKVYYYIVQCYTVVLCRDNHHDSTLLPLVCRHISRHQIMPRFLNSSSSVDYFKLNVFRLFDLWMHNTSFYAYSLYILQFYFSYYS